MLVTVGRTSSNPRRRILCTLTSKERKGSALDMSGAQRTYSSFHHFHCFIGLLSVAQKFNFPYWYSSVQLPDWEVCLAQPTSPPCTVNFSCGFSYKVLCSSKRKKQVDCFVKQIKLHKQLGLGEILCTFCKLSSLAQLCRCFSPSWFQNRKFVKHT